MNKIKIPRHPVFKSFAIVTIGDEQWVCPGWIQIPFGTSRDDIEWSDDIIIEKKKVVTEVKAVQNQSHKVLSSNGKKEYDVTLMNGIWSCTCPAANFRRGDCKHIKGIKEK